MSRFARNTFADIALFPRNSLLMPHLLPSALFLDTRWSRNENALPYPRLLLPQLSRPISFASRAQTLYTKIARSPPSACPDVFADPYHLCRHTKRHCFLKALQIYCLHGRNDNFIPRAQDESLLLAFRCTVPVQVKKKNINQTRYVAMTDQL